MCVGWVQATRGIVNAGHGYAQGVESWDLLNIGSSDQGAECIVGETWFGQTDEEEILCRYVLLAGESIYLHTCLIIKACHVISQITQQNQRQLMRSKEEEEIVVRRRRGKGGASQLS